MPSRIDDLERFVDMMLCTVRQALCVADENTFKISLKIPDESLEETSARLTRTANGLSELAVLMDQAVVRLSRYRVKGAAENAIWEKSRRSMTQ